MENVIKPHLSPNVEEEVHNLRVEVELLHERINNATQRPSTDFFTPWYLIFGALLTIITVTAILILIQASGIHGNVAMIYNHLLQWEIIE